MITLSPVGSLPMPLQLFQTMVQGKTYSAPTVPVTTDFCWCGSVCTYVLPVFSGATDLKNDHTPVIYRRYSSSDTVTMKLYKDGALQATLTDNTYGVFYDFGSLFNANLKGYSINWSLAQAAFGTGTYQIITTCVWFGTTYTKNSSYFYLMPYNERAASGTVRMRGLQNGTTLNDPIDFAGCNWQTEIRVWGKFGDKQPEFVTDNYIAGDRARKQIQDQITNTFTLELLKMTGDEKDTFINQTLLGNNIWITDYDLKNDDRYKIIEVYPDSIEKLTYNSGRPGSSGKFKFKEKIQDTLKRNSSF